MAAHFRLAARAAARTQPQPPARILQLRPAAPRHQPLSQQLLSSSSSFHQLSRTYRSQSRRWYSSQQQQQQQQPPRNKKDPNRVAFWPFVVLIAITSGAWVLLVNKRQEMADAAKGGAPQDAAGPTPRFDDSEVTVLFVLGGPGAGKGTQCARLVDRYNFAHLSAGDLLRAEQARPGSEFGALISDCIRNGTIVPMEVTIKLLQNAMDDVLAEQQKSGVAKGKGGRFLIDGFPRKMDQAIKFEEDVCRAKLVLFYDCPEDVMEKRLLERGKTSGREDDNAESIRKRFRTFVETSMPVVDLYESEGRLVRISAAPPPDAVFKDTAEKIEGRLGADF
ncbi:related to UMP-CMP kinase [Cephalotrichum gorgonifer]|uniref:Uridylate kinase n=1 Tax=Cephalotrichum gorgonifer TaxID=2041049 RepID=A0AAE8MWS0_9PEZI|nr:related to UMP-CMP kinase [Cephalotrichum gorgonifer]